MPEYITYLQMISQFFIPHAFKCIQSIDHQIRIIKIMNVNESEKKTLLPLDLKRRNAGQSFQCAYSTIPPLKSTFSVFRTLLLEFALEP